MKYLKGALIALFVVLCAGAATTEYGLETAQYTFRSVSTMDNTNDNGTSEVAVSDRDFSTFNGSHDHFDIPNSWNVIELRVQMDDDGDDTVFDLYASRGGHYTRVCTVTCKAGTQDSDSKHFADTITLTNENWITSVVVVDGGGNNRIARVVLDACGYRYWGLAANTTVDDDTIIEAAGY